MFYDDRWQDPSPDEAARLLADCAALDLPYRLDAATTSVGLHRPDFYPSVELVRLADPGWEVSHLELFFLRREGKLHHLNGTAPTIHETNAAGEISITDTNVLDYLEFFCFFVRGEAGPFLIVHSLSTSHVPFLPDRALASQLEELICPPFYSGRDGRDHRGCEATILYGNSLFAARFEVAPSGMVRMGDDEPLVFDLPVHVDAPIT